MAESLHKRHAVVLLTDLTLSSSRQPARSSSRASPAHVRNRAHQAQAVRADLGVVGHDENILEVGVKHRNKPTHLGERAAVVALHNQLPQRSTSGDEHVEKGALTWVRIRLRRYRVTGWGQPGNVGRALEHLARARALVLVEGGDGEGPRTRVNRSVAGDSEAGEDCIRWQRGLEQAAQPVLKKLSQLRKKLVPGQVERHVGVPRVSSLKALDEGDVEASVEDGTQHTQARAAKAVRIGGAGRRQTYPETTHNRVKSVGNGNESPGIGWRC